MEIRAYNILRHQKYQIEPIPATALYLAHIRGRERRARRDRIGQIIDRCALGTVGLFVGYLGMHLILWAVR